MKQNVVIVVCSLAVIAAALAIALWLPAGHAVFTPAAPAAAAGVSQKSAGGYTVRISDGKIAVFADGSKAPQQVLDISVQDLPEAEQQRLSAGIHVGSHDELLRLLENYTS